MSADKVRPTIEVGAAAAREFLARKPRGDKGVRPYAVATLPARPTHGGGNHVAHPIPAMPGRPGGDPG